MIKTCVIGGTGFIGRHMVDLLVKKGRSVTVIGRKHPELVNFSKDVIYFAHDYGDTFFLEKVLSNTEEIICLAYTTNPKTSSDNPSGDITTNLSPMVNLLGVASELNLKKFILISSGGAIYGQAQSIPIPENHPTNPISSYGITKLAIEKYALMFHQTKNLPLIIIRPSNCYGPGQVPFTGQGFVGTAIASILTSSKIQLFGQNKVIRDHLYISDAAQGIFLAMTKGKIGSCYNMGTGIGTTNREILEFLKPMAKSHGLNVKSSFLPKRFFDVEKNVLDSSKMTRETSWQPNVSLDKGLIKTWGWFAKNYEIKTALHTS